MKATPLAFRDWTKPSSPRENSSSWTFWSSRLVMGRESSGYPGTPPSRAARPQGVYWAIRLTGMPGKRPAMVRSAAMEFFVWPGKIRWRMSTPRVIMPSPSYWGAPVWRTISAMAARAVSG